MCIAYIQELGVNGRPVAPSTRIKTRTYKRVDNLLLHAFKKLPDGTYGVSLYHDDHASPYQTPAAVKRVRVYEGKVAVCNGVPVRFN